MAKIRNLKFGFTLLEVLISIGVLAILTTTVVMIINPTELNRQANDGNRVADLQSINKALLLYQSFGASNLGNHQTIYISLPDSDPQCGSYYSLLMATSSPWNYRCAPAATYRNIDGTGWIPVDFTSIQSNAGTLFSRLPIDPVNTSTGQLYFTYISGSWALSSALESEKYLNSLAVNDGGADPTRFEIGNELALNNNLGSAVGAPSVPQNLLATAGNQQVELDWSAPTTDGGATITSYKVYRSTSSETEILVSSGGCSGLGGVLSCTDTGLTNGTTYYYKISAVNSIGESALSGESNIALNDVPSAPQSFAASVTGNQQVTLTWAAPASDGGSTITNYEIYRGTSSGGEIFLDEVGNVLTYINSGLSNGTTYYYKVAAKNSVDIGTQTAEKTSGMQEFLSSGTFTTPTGVQYADVILAGGGGGGGGGCAGGGGGGGSGYISIYNQTAVSGNMSVTVGSGGSAGVACGAAGGTGGTTSFGSLSASGGTGGSPGWNNSGYWTGAAGGSGASGGGGGSDGNGYPTSNAGNGGSGTNGVSAGHGSGGSGAGANLASYNHSSILGIAFGTGGAGEPGWLCYATNYRGAGGGGGAGLSTSWRNGTGGAGETTCGGTVGAGPENTGAAGAGGNGMGYNGAAGGSGYVLVVW